MVKIQAWHSKDPRLQPYIQNILFLSFAASNSFKISQYVLIYCLIYFEVNQNVSNRVKLVPHSGKGLCEQDGRPPAGVLVQVFNDPLRSEFQFLHCCCFFVYCKYGLQQSKPLLAKNSWCLGLYSMCPRQIWGNKLYCPWDNKLYLT